MELCCCGQAHVFRGPQEESLFDGSFELFVWVVVGVVVEGHCPGEILTGGIGCDGRGEGGYA